MQNYHKAEDTHYTATRESGFFPFISALATNTPRETDSLHKISTHATNRPKTPISLTPAYKSTTISLFAPWTMHQQTKPFFFLFAIKSDHLGPVFFFSHQPFQIQMPTPKMDLKIHRNRHPQCDLI